MLTANSPGQPVTAQPGQPATAHKASKSPAGTQGAAPANSKESYSESVITEAFMLTATIYAQMVEKTLPFMNDSLNQINDQLNAISQKLANTKSSDTKEIYALKGQQTVLQNSSRNLMTLVSSVSQSATTVASIFQKMASIMGQTVTTMSQQW